MKIKAKDILKKKSEEIRKRTPEEGEEILRRIHEAVFDVVSKTLGVDKAGFNNSHAVAGAATNAAQEEIDQILGWSTAFPIGEGHP